LYSAKHMCNMSGDQTPHALARTFIQQYDVADATRKALYVAAWLLIECADPENMATRCTQLPLASA
jgi:hypothetical protein